MQILCQKINVSGTQLLHQKKTVKKLGHGRNSWAQFLRNRSQVFFLRLENVWSSQYDIIHLEESGKCLICLQDNKTHTHTKPAVVAELVNTSISRRFNRPKGQRSRVRTRVMPKRLYDIFSFRACADKSLRMRKRFNIVRACAVTRFSE